MAQHDYVIANQSGAAFRADLNNGLAAIVTLNSGATAPSTTYAYMLWADTTAGLLKMRNAANNAWITLRELDGTLVFEDGTAAAPALAFASDLNTGIYRIGADSLGISTGGVNRLLANSSGQVAVTLAGSAATPSFTKDDDLNTGLFYPAADTLAITTGGTERARIDSSGNVGIGTNSPAAPLQVYPGTITGSSSKEVLRINVPGNNISSTATGYIGFRGHDISNIRERDVAYIGTQLAEDGSGAPRMGGNLVFGTCPTGASQTPTERLRIDSSGRVGIATLSASARLHVEGSDTVSSQANVAAVIGTGTSSLLLGSTNGNAPFVASQGAYPLAFFTNASEAMRINTSQELLVGYTTDNGAYKLQVNSQIFATSSTIATSDGRYKENIATLGGCVDLIKTLRPVSFTWKPQEDITRVDENGNTVLVREGHNFPEGTQVGFIAQEVQEVLAEKPWLASVIKQNKRPAIADAEGNELAPEEEFLGIAEGNLIAVLTSALQEAVERIEQLEAKVTALESN